MSMERDMNQSTAHPTLCRSGCGFYGSAASDGLCSQCFKDSLKKKNDPGRLSPSTGKLSAHNAADMLPCSSGENAAAKANMVAGMAHTGKVFSPAALELAKPDSPFPSSITSSCVHDNSVITSQDDDVAATVTGSSSMATVSTASQSSVSDEMQPQSQEPIKRKSNRCDKCRKKVGLTGFECRCGGHFCASHRYSDMHECSVDYKALGAEQIRKNNPMVVAEKVGKL